MRMVENEPQTKVWGIIYSSIPHILMWGLSSNSQSVKN
jgi:hypothetical protein